MTINPYLNFPGTAEEAFTFYKSVFGGEFTALQRFSDITEGGNIPADAIGKIMHIALPIGPNTMLMATDALESMGKACTVGNNFYLSINADSEEEANRLFNTLSANGKVEFAMQKTFWGDYFGMLKDQFDIQWMISYTFPKPQ